MHVILLNITILTNHWNFEFERPQNCTEECMSLFIANLSVGYDKIKNWSALTVIQDTNSS